MGKYERVNQKSGRLFVTEQEKLADNPKLPVLNGTIMVDGVVMYLGLWKRKSKNGSDYFTAELTYPADETARLKADGPATSKAAAKEREYEEKHPKSKENDKGRWESRQSGGESEAEDIISGDDMPF